MDYCIRRANNEMDKETNRSGVGGAAEVLEPDPALDLFRGPGPVEPFLDGREFLGRPERLAERVVSVEGGGRRASVGPPAALRRPLLAPSPSLPLPAPVPQSLDQFEAEKICRRYSCAPVLMFSCSAFVASGNRSARA